MQRIVVAAVLLTLVPGAVAWLVRDDASRAEAAQPRPAATETVEPVVLVEPARDADAAAPRAPAGSGGEDVHAARVCPDLQSLVEAQARQLGDRSRVLERDWVADCALRARGFDLHCVLELARMGEQPSRAPAQRLAALSLAAVRADHAGALELDPLTRAWLRARTQPDASEVESAFERAATAKVAALCLVWLGDAQDRARLIDDAIAGSRTSLAAFALVHARDDDVAEPLVAALERGGDARSLALSVLAQCGEERAFEWTPAQTERAVRALLDGAGEDPVLVCGSGGAGDGSLVDHAQLNLALAAIDPRAVAELWSERIDAGRLTPEATRWAVIALLRRGAPDDERRLGSMLLEGSQEQRSEVALWLAECTEPGGPRAALRSAALDRLLETARGDGARKLRQRALLALERADDLGPRAGEVQALAEQAAGR